MQYDAEDIFDELRSVLDPERPSVTLAQLDVVNVSRCFVTYVPVAAAAASSSPCRPTACVRVVLKPTVPHCHLMHLICLSVRVRLFETLPVSTNWKVDISIVEGSHLQRAELEKQVNDKERVAAAMENTALMAEVQKLVNPFMGDH
jgi:hypothetical protein